MKIDIITKRIMPIMLSLAILLGASSVGFAAGETDDKTELFAKHVSVSKNVTELIRNADGTTGTNKINVFTDRSNFDYTKTNEYLQVTNNYTSNSDSIARFCVRIAMAKGTLPAYNKENKLIIESKMRIESDTEADDWFNIGITNGIPAWETSAVPLAGVKMVSASDKTMKVRLGGFTGGNLEDNTILDAVYPEGEFISYKITIDVPEGVSDTDTVPVSYEINGVKQDYTAQLPVSLLKAVYESSSPRIVYGTQNKYSINSAATELICEVDDLIVTSITDENLYYKSADFTEVDALPSDFISSTNTAAPTFNSENGVTFDVPDKDQYVCPKTNGHYLSEYDKPFVVETRIKFDPFDDKGQLRIQARGRDKVNGTNAYNQAATMTLMTFNRGSIVLRSNINPQPDAPYSVKIGEFAPNIWYNVKLIFSITDEKMYAYVYTDDYSYETAGVVDIPLEKMYNYNLESLSEINSLGVYSGTSNGGRATSYVSDFKMYAADVEQGELEYIEAQTPDSIKDAVQVSFSDVVDLTQLDMTVKCNGEEYTDYQTLLAGDGRILTITPLTEWEEGRYTIEFNDTVKGYFGGACTVSNDITFEFVLKTEVTFDEDNKRVTAKLNDPTGKTEDAIMYFAAYNSDNRLILADKAEVKNSQEIIFSNLPEEVSYVQVFVWSKNFDAFTDAEKIYRNVNQ